MPKKTKNIKIFSPRIVRFSTLAIFVLAAGLLVFFNFKKPSLQVGQYQPNDIYSGENLSHSLDLNLAAKAKYASSRPILVKDLGTESNINTSIISFGVPTDGLTEYALQMKPTTPQPKTGYPFLVLCHSYINPADYRTQTGYLADMRFYASHGFLVVKPDFRGQGLSTGQGQPEGAYYSMAYNTDVLSLISAYKTSGEINDSNINLWGHSMGAYVALRASVVSKEIKNTLLLSGPVGSLKQLYLSYVPPSDENNPVALMIRNDIFSKYGTPAEDTKYWRDASPSNFLKTTKARYQIHVGLKDAVVPPQMSADLNDQLTSYGIAHEYFEYPEGNHSLIQQRQTIWTRSLALLQRP